MGADVSLLGNLNIDMLILGDGPKNWEQIFGFAQVTDVHITAAGTVGYTSQDLAKLGLRAQVVSAVSDDPFSNFVLDTLNKKGVNCTHVQIEEGKEGGIAIYMLLFGDRKRPAAYRMPTHNPWPMHFSTAQMDAIMDARLFHSGGYLHFKDHWHGVVAELYQEAKQRGLITCMDPQFPLVPYDPPWMRAMDDLLPNIDIFICDEIEARNLTQKEDLDEAAMVLMDSGPETVVIKQGAEGSTVYQNEFRYHQNAIQLGDVVDSIGAGDAYCAGFIFGTLQNWPLEKRAKFASTAAAFTVLGVGGTDTFAPLQKILENMPA